MLHGPIFVSDFDRDIDQVAEILHKDFSSIYQKPRSDHRAKRPMLSAERSLGSVIKLMTPSPEYTDEHNEWLSNDLAHRAPAAGYRQALLPAGMGRQLARSISVSTASMATSATN